MKLTTPNSATRDLCRAFEVEKDSDLISLSENKLRVVMLVETLYEIQKENEIEITKLKNAIVKLTLERLSE